MPIDLDIAFVIGTSQLNANDLLRKQKEIVKHILNSYDISPGKTHAGIIIRSNPSAISLEIGQIKNREMFYKQLDKIEIVGKGSLADALAIASNGVFSQRYGARPDFRKSLVVFVDGDLDADKAVLKSTGEKLRKKGVNMIVIDVSSGPDMHQREKTPYYDVFFFPPSLDDLEIALYPVVEAMQPGTLFLFHFVLFLFISYHFFLRTSDFFFIPWFDNLMLSHNQVLSSNQNLCLIKI